MMLSQLIFSAPDAGPRRLRLPAILCTACLLAGCATSTSRLPSPDAQLAALPASYPSTLPGQGDSITLAQWWEGFGDPTLPKLVRAALEHSPDIEQAAARRDEALAAASAARAQRLPQLNLRSTASRAADAASVSTSSAAAPMTTRNAGFEASWEVDLFGRLARGASAARADVLASEHLLQAARVSVAAEVARNYIAARGCRTQQASMRSEIGSLEESIAVEGARVAAGRLAAGELSQVLASRGELQLRLHLLEARCAGADAALAALTGISRKALLAELERQPLSIPRFRSAPGQPVPADLLRQRADVVAREAAVAAAVERLGAAQAARLPTLSLTGALRWESLSVGGADLALRTWSLAPTLAAMLFDGGLRQAQVEAAHAQARAALADWRRAVLSAAAEAEDTMGQLAAGARRLPAALDVVSQHRAAVAVQESRRSAGRVGVLEVELARRALYEAEAVALDAEESLATLWVTLYRSLGGHWESPPASAGS